MAPVTAEPVKLYVAPKRLVLLVDDEPVVLAVCEREFEAYPKLLLDACDNVKDALDKVETISYDAAILDMAFPDGRHGLEVLRRIRRAEMESYSWRQQLKMEWLLVGDPQVIPWPLVRTATFVLTGSMCPISMALSAQAMGVTEVFDKPVEFTGGIVQTIIARIQKEFA